jgi:hypothetical protein
VHVLVVWVNKASVWINKAKVLSESMCMFVTVYEYE